MFASVCVRAFVRSLFFCFCSFLSGCVLWFGLVCLERASINTEHCWGGRVEVYIWQVFVELFTHSYMFGIFYVFKIEGHTGV